LIARRIIFAVAALAALAAAAGTIVVASAFAVYSLLRDVFTPAGAAAVVALSAAVLAAILALLAARQAKWPVRRGGRRSDPPPPLNPIDRVVELARERPFVAAGAAVAAGLLALANPALVTAAMRAFISPRKPPRR
jgi:hypothetical protein